MTNIMDALQQHFDSNLPFVSYRKPNENRLKSVFQHDDSLHYVTDFKEEGFVFAPFNATQKAVLIPFEEVKESIFRTEKTTSIPNNSTDVSTHKSSHIALVEKAKQAIQKGGFQKIVVSRKQNIIECTTKVVTLFKRLLNLYPNAFVYIWYHPKVGCWLGATPETLLQIKGNNFKTMSLAGTQPFSEVINWQDKEKEEQQMVTNYITKCLQQDNISFTVGAVNTVKAGDLAHLCTEINGRIPNTDVAKIIHILHPTPAVCGLPKEASKAFILENENYNREFYTGFLGELNIKVARSNNKRNIENHAYHLDVNATNLFVNLRCMQWHNNQISIYVGGGITANSDSKAEYQETVNKAKTMLSALNL